MMKYLESQQVLKTGKGYESNECVNRFPACAVLHKKEKKKGKNVPHHCCTLKIIYLLIATKIFCVSNKRGKKIAPKKNKTKQKIFHVLFIEQQQYCM